MCHFVDNLSISILRASSSKTYSEDNGKYNTYYMCRDFMIAMA